MRRAKRNPPWPNRGYSAAPVRGKNAKSMIGRERISGRYSLQIRLPHRRSLGVSSKETALSDSEWLLEALHDSIVAWSTTPSPSVMFATAAGPCGRTVKKHLQLGLHAGRAGLAAGGGKQIGILVNVDLRRFFKSGLTYPCSLV